MCPGMWTMCPASGPTPMRRCALGIARGGAGELQARSDGRAGGFEIESGIAIHVDVRSLRHGHSPPGHGGSGIKLGGFAEGSQGFVAVEAVQKRETLVEVALGVGAGS